MIILQINISASILIIIVATIRAFAINRLPKRTFLILWGIIFFRLLTPFSIPIKWSPFNLISKSAYTLAAGQDIISGTISSEPLKELTSMGQNTNLTNQSINALSAFLISWAIGSIILLLIFIISYIKSYYKLQEALPIENNKIILEWIEKQPSIRKRISILTSDRITTPITLGFIKPKIIFPRNIDYRDEQQLIYVLGHEMVHIKRLDNLWKFISMIAVCIHWFNPLVWVTYVLFNCDIEITCDEKVISINVL